MKKIEISGISIDTYVNFATKKFIGQDLSDVAIHSTSDSAYEMRYDGKIVGIVKIADIKEPFTLMQGLICKSGFGKLMIDWVKQRHTNPSILITVTGSNQKLIKYYKRQGFRKLTTENKNILMIWEGE